MNSCRKCGQSSTNRLCRECEFDEDREYHERAAQEMLDAEEEGDA